MGSPAVSSAARLAARHAARAAGRSPGRRRAQMKQFGYYLQEVNAARAYDEFVSLYRPGAEVNFPAHVRHSRGADADDDADGSDQPVRPPARPAGLAPEAPPAQGGGRSAKERGRELADARAK